jgi:superfamily II DNA helicase RecQ
MSNLEDALGALSISDSYALYQTRQRLEARLRVLSGEELARSRVLLRLLIAHQARTDGKVVGPSDVLVLLRQIIRYHGKVEVPRTWWQSIPTDGALFGLRANPLDDARVEVRADDWMPDWLPGAYNIDQLAVNRHQQPVFGDAILSAMMSQAGKAIESYQSEGQRQAVHAALFAPPGSTTLIVLPTGAGKSLCVQLPAWVDSQGGQRAGGTTLVIVPTVALAIDQVTSARRYFTVNDPLCIPQAILGSTSQDDRRAIRKGVEAGSIPLLYISPESLLNSEFYEIILKMVREGRMSRIAIDEAHLVEGWGASFRTEFQLLATYLRLLHHESAGRIRLILLSATVVGHVYATLRHLFTLPDGDFIDIRYSHLRPEISYWMALSYAKEKHVLEALRHLPRPAILYLTAPDEAERWLKILRDNGYARLATFTGDTPADRRNELIDQWRRDDIDLMIATSAFGLGVDKPDVRAIIHATFPENIDRFYQEVGRGGRDGCSSISLLVTNSEDFEYALKTAASSRITSEKAWERWSAMFYGAEVCQGLRKIDLQTTRLATMRASDKNQDWNEHTLLLMQRARVIRLVHPPNELSEKSPTALWIEILDSDAVNTQAGFMAAFESARESELRHAKAGCQKLWNVVQEQTSDPRQCIAEPLSDVYEIHQQACGGCAACRQANQRAYSASPDLESSHQFLNSTGFRLHPALERKLHGQRVIHLIDEQHMCRNEANLASLIAEGMALGIIQIILPDEVLPEVARQLIQHRAQSPYQPYRVLSYGHISDTPLYNLPTLLHLSESSPRVERAFKIVQRWYGQARQPIFYLAPLYLELASLNGRLIERVEGHRESVDRFIDWSKNERYTL